MFISRCSLGYRFTCFLTSGWCFIQLGFQLRMSQLVLCWAESVVPFLFVYPALYYIAPWYLLFPNLVTLYILIHSIHRSFLQLPLWPKAAKVSSCSTYTSSCPYLHCKHPAVISRQFREMQRSRIEGLLASFPKLTSTGHQHTTVETEHVRYVYQPLEELFMVLITNRQVNIVSTCDIHYDCCWLTYVLVQHPPRHWITSPFRSRRYWHLSLMWWTRYPSQRVWIAMCFWWDHLWRLSRECELGTGQEHYWNGESWGKDTRDHCQGMYHCDYIQGYF